MDRCALFVDAGYVLGEGALAVHGTRNRDSVSWDYAGVLKLLGGLSRDRTGLPLLRCYWYDTAAEGGRAAEHETLADVPGVKLRLSKVRPSRKEGVEAEIRKDLSALARNRAVSDVIIVSAEEDLGPVIAEVQDLGVRAILLHISVDGDWGISRVLRQECDEIIEIAGGHLRPFVDLIAGAEPAGRESHLATSGYRELGANAAGQGGQFAPQVQQHAIAAPMPDLYQSPIAADYDRAGQAQAAASGRDQQLAPPVRDGMRHAASSDATSSGAAGRRSDEQGQLPPQQYQSAERGSHASSETPRHELAGYSQNAFSPDPLQSANGHGRPEPGTVGQPGPQNSAPGRQGPQHSGPAQQGSQHYGSGQQASQHGGSSHSPLSAVNGSVQAGMQPGAPDNGLPSHGSHSNGMTPGGGSQHGAEGGYGARESQHPGAGLDQGNGLGQHGGALGQGNGLSSQGHGLGPANGAGSLGYSNGAGSLGHSNGAGSFGQSNGLGQHGYGASHGNGLSQGNGLSRDDVLGQANGMGQPGGAQDHSNGLPSQANGMGQRNGIDHQPGNGLSQGGQAGNSLGSMHSGRDLPAGRDPQPSQPHGLAGHGGQFAPGQHAQSGHGMPSTQGMQSGQGMHPSHNMQPDQGMQPSQGMPPGQHRQTAGLPPATGGGTAPSAPLAPGMPPTQGVHPSLGGPPTHGGPSAPGSGQLNGRHPNELQPNNLMPMDPARGIPQRQLPGGNGLPYPPDRAGQYGGQYAAPPSSAPYPPAPYSGPQQVVQPPAPPATIALSVGEAVQSAHSEGFGFGEAVARDAPALWLEAVLARKPRMPSDLEARLLQGSALPIDSLLHDEVRHALRRGFWDALERSRH